MGYRLKLFYTSLAVLAERRAGLIPMTEQIWGPQRTYYPN
jgi:hypothetical protein